ncbi:MAG TPA: AAA family ATPase [Saprospiraceae bacterium]|nr:AAA family ATPase [Saprospiraceae bacterium]HMP22697.1 AAA family ATPase [Saprospiraceae bacterium]
MPSVQLKIPVFVKNTLVDNRAYYHVRPVFAGYPVASHHRLELATNRFKQEIRQYFKGFQLQRHNAEHLLWYLFNPELAYQTFEYDFSSSELQARGKFGVVFFTLQNMTFACLPNVNNFMFLAGQGDISMAALQPKVGKIVKMLLTQAKHNQNGDFDPEAFYANGREFLTEVAVNVHITAGNFQHQMVDHDWIFSRLREAAEFDGAMEVEKTGYDLNSRYPAELGRAFYQDDKVNKIYHIVFQPENTPLVIVGEEGVGKHALLHEVVWRYQSDFYGQKKGRRTENIWHIDPTRIISGMSIQGMWQKRFEAMLDYIMLPDEPGEKPDKLLIDNSIALLRIGKSSQTNMTLSDVLKPYLEKRQLQIILIATPEEWKIVQEKDRGFADLFQVLRIYEPPADISARIVLEQRKVLEREHGCIITIEAIHELFTIQRNYFRNRAMPGSLLKMLRQLVARYQFSKIDAPQVREAFKDLSGLKERMLDAGERLDEKTVHQALAQELIGQPAAVAALENVVHLSKAKLHNSQKPLSSFLFVGPTGVGKTQAAKVLCHYLMGSEAHLLRFDMNEYIDNGALQRLIGDFYNPEGQLTGKVRYQPFGILLLDEIEKAHPGVHDLLLQLLDEGRLTDSLGRTVDFSNTIIIMTSNLGAQEVNDGVGFRPSAENDEAIYRKAIERFFRPEFINRIDEIVVFQPLDMEHIQKIARLQIRELLQRDGFVRRTTILNISQEALEWVARRGFNVRMGGRALKRQIERDLTTLSAEQLITTYNESPILLDITFENGHLLPHITPFEFLDLAEENWLPTLPEEKRGKSFYSRLLAAVERIQQSIVSIHPKGQDPDSPIVIGDDSQLDWQFYDFKNKVSEMEEKIRFILPGFRERFMHEAPAIPLRLKRVTIPPHRSDRAFRENFRDRLFQEEGLRELRETYQTLGMQFDTVQTDFISHFLDVALLALAVRGFLRNHSDKLVIRFESLITGLGERETTYLLEQYSALLRSLDIHHEVNKKTFTITAEGYALFDLLRGEAGVHLFYIQHRTPLPVRMMVYLQQDAMPPADALKVLRIYDGNSTLTDLRTGFSNAVNMTPDELKLLVFAGIAPNVRAGLMGDG